MAAPYITLENIENCLNFFNEDLKNCNTKFEKFQDTLISLLSDFRSKRYDFKDTLKELHYDILHELKGVDQFTTDEDYHNKKFKSKRDKFNSVLVESRKAIDKLVTDVDYWNVDKNSQIKNCEIVKENSLPNAEESVNKPISKVPTFILNSRQTKEPFQLMTMKAGFRHKCNGCKQNIPNESLYLSHIEEYPAGSKTFIPHCYHITSSCIFQRGFEVYYLKNVFVRSEEPINNVIINVLKEIGFKKKNIQLEISEINDCHINEANDSDEFADNASEASDISSNLSIASSNMHTSIFIYRNKHPNQKNILCDGCKLNIDTKTYITFKNENKCSLPFHIKKTCLKEGGVLPDDFSRTICKVFKLLKSHSQLQELIACGFLYNKIIGYRPSNSNIKKTGNQMLKENKDNSDCSYIFNEEPFVLERLPHGEKCKGCQKIMKRDETSLRHKERVPRDKLEYSPLISQYYHANKQCLLNRGFTMKYLSFIRCNAILGGDDNLSGITDVLIKCGFHNDNIVYNPKDTDEPRGFEVASQRIKSVKDYKLYIDNCTNSQNPCKGCGFILIPNEPCFLYGFTAVQDSNSKMFHIRNSCLRLHFSNEELENLICVTNNNIELSPNDIINCGISNIENPREKPRY